MLSKRILHVRLATAWLAFALPLCSIAQEDPAADNAEPAARPAGDIPDKQQALFDLIGVEEAWAITRGSPECLIGVVDTGFDFFHPALRDAVTPGYVADDVFHLPAFPIVAHGTAMASLIVAQRVEPDGMIGLAPDCRVLAASQGMPEHALMRLQEKITREHPDATMAEIQQELMKHSEELRGFGQRWVEYVARTTSEAIRDLADRKVKVISISAFFPRTILAGVPGAAEELDAAFAYAIEHDVVIVIGAGNNATRVEEYPGDADTVLIAGASTMEDERWVMEVEIGGQKISQGSCTGPRLSVMAPSENLVIASPHEKALYELDDSPMGPVKVEFDGLYTVEPNGATSSATAIVAALAALVRSARPDLGVTDVVRIVKQSALDLGEPGFDEETGFGRVDFAQALKMAQEAPRGEKQGAEAVEVQ
jgi:subtilisin family serine protease